MVQFDNQYKQVKLKVVYYGPALGGKTTCLKYIHRVTDPTRRTKLYALNTASDRTLFFDLLGIDLGRVRGYRLMLQLFTVPGQVQYNATRRAVLAGADGVLFVADSQSSQQTANEQSLANLAENLKANGLDAATIPLVFAYNKRDLPEAMDCATLNASLNRRGVPWFATVATTGEGVMESFAAIAEATVRSVGDRLGLAAQPEAMERLLVGVRAALQPFLGPPPSAESEVVIRPKATAETLSAEELVSEAVRANLSMTDLNAKLDQLGQELARRIRQLRAINEFGRLMSGARQSRQVTSGFLDALLRELGVSCGSLLLERNGTLEEVERRGLAEDPFARPQADGRSPVAAVVESQQPFVVFVDETGPITSRLTEELLGLGLVAGLSVPLVAQGRVLGVATAYGDAARGAFSDDDRDLAMGLAANAAVALAHLRALGALEEANRTLEATVAARTRELELALTQQKVLTEQLEARRQELEAANARLGELEALKGELLSYVASAFEEPVRSIQTAARVLMREEGVSEKATKLLEVVHAEVTRLADLIVSTRQATVLSAAEGGSVTEVAVADLMKRALSPLRSAIGERKLSVHVKVAQGLERLLARAEQLEVALRAVLRNAVEYNTPGGSVTVIVQPTQRDGKAFTEIQVTDTGQGIPAEDIPKARERFWRGAAGEAAAHGLGLGLTVASRVAEAHQGTLEIRSEPGRGTTVSILLPARSTPA
ncbi:MAG: GAF domain-containing protein [Thermoanaerobaculaceae bacterium]|jgi:signal transduction histidine kinase/signal recognition particle receptor subunit beta|nr:GAF domain-containing protein [Thermoanaerobaculaceae bacterium]